MFKKHILLETEGAEEIGLVAIHSSVEAYLLAYKFNQHLFTQFINLTETSSEKQSQPLFSRFVWEPTHGEDPWELIANQYIFTEESNDNLMLFSTLLEKKKYLIDQMSAVDFFLKLPSKQLSKNTLAAIQKLTQVQLAYTIQNPTIKLNPNLIFE